jgi:hypothetical protein
MSGQLTPELNTSNSPGHGEKLSGSTVQATHLMHYLRTTF